MTPLCTCYPCWHEMFNPHSELAENEPEKGVKSLSVKKGRQRVSREAWLSTWGVLQVHVSHVSGREETVSQEGDEMEAVKKKME